MTTGNATNLEDLTDDELEALQRKADGESEEANSEANPNGEASAASAEADPAPSPSAEAAANTAGADAPDTSTTKIEGVASKDGSRILPYSALQAERRNARTANARYESAVRELDDAKKLIADMKAGKTPDTGEVTEEDVRAMEEDFPEQGKKMRALFERAQAAAVSKPSAQTEPEVSDDPVQDAIDQVPLLVEWQTTDAEKFERAKEHDRVLANSPKWRDKPVVERFEHVAKLVADEYDIDFQPSKTSNTKPTPSPAKPSAADAAPRANPNTLSDFKGGAVPDHGTVNVKNMSPQTLLGRYSGMTDAEIDAELARLG